MSMTSALQETHAKMAAIMDRASVRMTGRDALEHVADLLRTRIKPGADPRAECAAFSWKMNRDLLTQRPRAIAETDTFDADGSVIGIRCVVMDNWRASVGRFVPEDVARWRDPEHRAAMVERARRYATERVTYSWPP